MTGPLAFNWEDVVFLLAGLLGENRFLNWAAVTEGHLQTARPKRNPFLKSNDGSHDCVCATELKERFTIMTVDRYVKKSVCFDQGLK